MHNSNAMRMWMVDPRRMCRKHLLGEHVEIHMLVGSINKGISLKGYLDEKIIEPRSMLKRHNELAAEMLLRGYKHYSPLRKPLRRPNPAYAYKIRVDVSRSKKDLSARCRVCFSDKARYKQPDA